jgi:hypothetical protein
VFVTRRGKEISETRGYAEFLKTRLFPRESLHPLIAEKTYGLFLRGEYETAIFQAMKEVEVAVRAAAGYDAKAIGVDLMRKAFHPSTGPLTTYANGPWGKAGRVFPRHGSQRPAVQ